MKISVRQIILLPLAVLVLLLAQPIMAAQTVHSPDKNDQTADELHRDAVTTLDQAETRIEEIYESIGILGNFVGDVKGAHPKIQNLAISLNEKHDQVSQESVELDRLAKGLNGKDISGLQTSAYEASQRLKIISDSVQEMVELRDRQLTIAIKAKYATEVSASLSRDFLTVEDVDKLIDAAAKLLEEARLTGGNSMPSNLEQLAKNNKIDLEDIRRKSDGTCNPPHPTCPNGTVGIPDLLYRPSAAAEGILNQGRLILGTTSLEASYSTPAGKIMSQYPYVGQCVKPNTRVNIVVSNGGTTPAVPSKRVMTSLSIQPAAIELHVGQRQQFTAVALFSDNSTDAVSHRAAWTGDSNTDTFTATTPGNYRLTTTFNDVSRTATIIVRQPRWTLKSLTMVPPAMTLPAGRQQLFRVDATSVSDDGQYRFEDVSNKASWSSNGPVFHSQKPGPHTVTASYGGQTISALITVEGKQPPNISAGKNNATGSPSPGGDPLAAKMMSDPTRTGIRYNHPPANDPGIGDFSPFPASSTPQNPLSNDDDWDGVDLDQQARAKREAQRRRDDNLSNANDQKERDQSQAWDTTLAKNQADSNRQDILSRQDLGSSRQQGRQAIDTMHDDLDRQQKQREAFQKRMDALEKAAAAAAQPADPAGAGTPGDSGGLSSVLVSQRNITIKIWDHGIVDNDKIILKVNHSNVSNVITLKGPIDPYIHNLYLPFPTNRIEIYAVNEGSSSPNTASVWTSHVTQGKAEQEYSINQKEDASYGITVSY